MYELARNIVRYLGEKDPFVRLTIQRSAVVRATTEDTAKCLYKIGASKVDIVPEVGLLKDEVEVLSQYPLPDGQPIRFISVGRLLHWKGFHLGLKAFAKAGLSDAEYWVVGDGPELERLTSLASKYGVEKQVKFWGRLSREETLVKLSASHVLVHPSLHDSGGWVCIESMAAGRPVIALNLGGPAVQLNDRTGFRIEPHNPDRVIQDMASVMIDLASDPQLRVEMGLSARKFVNQNYGWDVLAKRLNSVYENIVAYNA